MPYSLPSRSAWIEIDLGQLRRNFDLIRGDTPPGVQLISVLKDNAYGHGAAAVARVAMEAGCWGAALATVDEGIELRDAGFHAPILLLGEREPQEFPTCLEHRLTCAVGSIEMGQALERASAERGEVAPFHLKVDTGMSRYGVRWAEVGAFLEAARGWRHVRLEGVMSHFAMSDELDKTFALQQLSRFREALEVFPRLGISPGLRHICNSGGIVDLPQAHLDAVRTGILPLGVYPSKVCHRLPGLKPVMSVKARIVSVKTIGAGESVGYGMRYVAECPRRIGVVALGYGDGFPRVRNEGYVLIRGVRAPIVGGVSMDAMMVDLTEVPGAGCGSDVVLLGASEGMEITIEAIAALKKSVTYDAMTAWRSRLPRIYAG